MYNHTIKSWGYEYLYLNNELYCGKLLHFFKNHFCSVHYHKLKDETFFIKSGRILLKYSDVPPEDYKSFMLNSVYLNEGATFRIPPGRIHQVFALEETDILEISTHHEDSDSYRLEPSCPL